MDSEFYLLNFNLQNLNEREQNPLMFDYEDDFDVDEGDDLNDNGNHHYHNEHENKDFISPLSISLLSIAASSTSSSFDGPVFENFKVNQQQQLQNSYFHSYDLNNNASTTITESQQQQPSSSSSSSSLSTSTNIPTNLAQKRSILDQLRTQATQLGTLVNNRWSYDECSICLDVQWLLIRSCCSIRACINCLSQYYSDRISMGAIAIECIGFGCHELVYRTEIQVRLSPERRSLYDRLLLEQSSESQYAKPCPQCSSIYSLSPDQRRMIKKSNIIQKIRKSKANDQSTATTKTKIKLIRSIITTTKPQLKLRLNRLRRKDDNNNMNQQYNRFVFNTKQLIRNTFLGNNNSLSTTSTEKTKNMKSRNRESKNKDDDNNNDKEEVIVKNNNKFDEKNQTSKINRKDFLSSPLSIMASSAIVLRKRDNNNNNNNNNNGKYIFKLVFTH